ncbi:hypothetical protein [Marinobacter caseinilyticus]|uniref:hypothetical protein n=1 Tax=Marinobacter caseinilyticus TaxID=2692195 RepID=UPI001A941DB2|nr:hypothetical protein [Marinobacter caseinilyticus]
MAKSIAGHVGLYSLMGRLFIMVFGLLALVATASETKSAIELDLTETQLAWVGQRIFQNECGGNQECLVHWNRGEAFPSLGIGHFIWYPEGADGPYVESFPALIAFMRARTMAIPPWLDTLEPFDAPWPDRDWFMALGNNRRVDSLRQFLANTQAVQAEFMFARAQSSLARVIQAAPRGKQDVVERELIALSTTPGGVYAMIDYVNFKGEGIAATETYKGQGWGLLQVLLTMPDIRAGNPLQRFQSAAIAVLTRRAENAARPIERNQWLPGWVNRLQTYREWQLAD